MSQNKNVPRAPLEVFPAGTVLAMEGDPIIAVMVLIRGEVSLSRNAQGRSSPIMIIGGPGFIGLLETYSGQPYWCRCTALTEVHIKRYAILPFRKYLDDPSDPRRKDVPIKLLSRTLYPLIQRVAELEANANYHSLMPLVLFDPPTAAGGLETDSHTPTQTLDSGRGAQPEEELATILVELVNDE